MLVTMSRNIRLYTAEYIPTRTAKQLTESILKVTRTYARGGFIVRLVLMDGEFEKVKDK